MKILLDYFEATERGLTDKTAFIDTKRMSSFGETYKNAKKIATRLFRYGIKNPIAVMIDKSCNCIDSILGALYANDFYVVIDVKSPKERIESILHTLRNPIILHDEKTADLAKEFEGEFTILTYEEIVNTEIDEAALQKVREDMIDLDIAYILFTSGSTGTPNGEYYL